MTHRERVSIALNHKEPDRIPLDLGGRVSTMVDKSYFNLKNELDLNPVSYEFVDEEWATVEEFDERILQRFDIDFRYVFLKGAEGNKKNVRSDGTWVDEMGFLRKKVGYYEEMLYHPLRDAKTIDDIKSFKFPDAYDPHRVEGLKERAEYLYNSTDYAIVGAPVEGGLLEHGFWFRGYENFCTDLMLNKSWVHVLIRKFTDFYLGLLDMFLSAAGQYMQMIELSDDCATQTSSMISPKLYKEIILPYYIEVTEFIRSKTKAKIFYHSDGSLIEMAPLLIEAGVEVLNSLQPRSYMMDTTYLKDTYKDKLSFHGGVDIQQVMPFGTTTDVEKEAKRRIAIYAPGGGYIFACSNIIQPDTPPINIITLYDSAKKWGKYPLSEDLMKIRENIR